MAAGGAFGDTLQKQKALSVTPTGLQYSFPELLLLALINYHFAAVYQFVFAPVRTV